MIGNENSFSYSSLLVSQSVDLTGNAGVKLT